MSLRSAHSGLLALTFIFLPAPLSAGIIVSEIMYDLPGADQGREWIEIENTGDAPVDITHWKLLEAGVHHKIVSAGTPLVPPRSFAVIADDRAAFMVGSPGYAGALFESSFSLGNSGETLAFLDASSTPVATAAYNVTAGASGDGNSLNANGGAWTPRRPTPGMPTSPDVILPPPKPAQTSEAPPRNLPPEPEVNERSASAPRGEARDGLAAVGAAALKSEGEGSTNLFAMLPWLGGLLLISLAGTLAVILGRKRSGSGYRITEEEP
ncbi:MAG: lamin tail domain-containing protein [Patescibacteria group bacterium]